MIEFLKKWFRREEERPMPRAIGDRRKSARPKVAQPKAVQPKTARPKTPSQPSASKPANAEKLDPNVAGRIESNGPGKNVLVRNKYQREDTGTHDTLKIIDDSALESDEETGIDPYNTGNFDRSKNWDKRFRN